MPPTYLRAALLPALALLLATGGRAVAQPTPPSATQATALEQQIRAALAEATGPYVALPARPAEFTPEGDHYNVRIPLSGSGSIDPADAAVTLRARPLDGPRWELTDQQFPPKLRVTTKPVQPDAPALVYDIVIGHQDTHGQFDPTFSTPASGTSTITAIDIAVTGGPAPHRTHFGRVVSQSSLQPISPGRVDVLNDAEAEDYATETVTDDGTAVTLTAERLHLVSALSGLAHEKLAPLIRLAFQASHIKPDPKAPKNDEAAKAVLRQMLVAAQSVLTGARVEESATGLKYNFAGHTGSAAKVDFALSGDAPQDMLTAGLAFTLDGLMLEELPPQFAVYVPTHLALRPTVSNLSAKDLTRIGMDATAPGSGDIPPADVAALFSHGGINFGLDALALDIAGTQFSGNGKFTMTGPQSVTGVAEITARGLEALIARAQADPLLAKGVPVIIFLKGIAHTTGDVAVWQISVADKKVLVNGVDLGAMAGALK